MDNYLKFELAKEVMSIIVAYFCKDGFNPNDPAMEQLLYEEREMNHFNLEVIDRIINEYAPLIKNGVFNG